MQTEVIYNKSCENMEELEDGSIDLIVTSPPYLNLRDYSSWNSYDEYCNWLDTVLKECFRVLHPGAWICWNIQECVPQDRNKGEERKGCYPLLADTIKTMQEAGFYYEKDIIWYKGKGTATQKLFGSFPYPSLILVSGLTEHIVTARKPYNGAQRKCRSEEVKEKSKLTKTEWGEWAVDLWEIPPVPSSETHHSAPFPIELAKRCIRLNSFWGDVVLDPFMGSGTTAIAARDLHRHYIGYELHEEYVQLCNERLNRTVDIFADD